MIMLKKLLLVGFLMLLASDQTDSVTNLARHLRIATILAEPFMFEIMDLRNKTQKIGLVKDILDELSKDMNFTYELNLVPAGTYGNQDENGVWDGLVGELVYTRTDMVAADMTVSAHWAEVIEFSVPFMNVDLGFIYKKPTVHFDFFAFLLPFSTSVWLLIAACLVLTSLSLFVFSKIFRREGDPLENITACFYFGIACLFAQGPETYPRSTFSRATAVSWWFFSLMVLTLYTASLTSMLTVNKTGLEIKSIEDLLNFNQYNYGTEPNSMLQRLFEHSEYEPFQKMWTFMNANKDNLLLLEGMQKVRDSDNYVYIHESPYLLYETTFAPCNLELVISPNSPKTGTGYAFGFPKSSPLVSDFNVEFLSLFENGKMAAIHSKWYKTTSECSLEKELTKKPEALGYDKVRGIFCTFLFGMVLSFGFFVMKLAHYFGMERIEKKKAEAKKRTNGNSTVSSEEVPDNQGSQPVVGHASEHNDDLNRNIQSPQVLHLKP